MYLYSSFNNTILKFYRQSWKWDNSLVASWLPALPLLHFLRRESKPFEDLVCGNPVDVTNLNWWGLDGLPYKEIRGHINERFALFFCLLSSS